MDDDNQALAALVYSEALRGLDQQAGVVESVRSRAGMLLSAAAVATSFLAGVALRDPQKHFDGWAWAATACFVGVALLCMWLLWPRHGWKFHANANLLVRAYLDQEAVTLIKTQRNLALHMERSYDANRQKLRWMFRFFECGCVLLAAEVGFWLLDLGGR